MNVMLASVGALGCYLVGALGQGVRINGGSASRHLILTVTTLGACFQALALYYVIHTPKGVNLGVFTIASLAMLAVTLVVLISSIKKPAESLLVLILPVAMLAVFMAWLTPLEHIVWRPPSTMVAHVLISVLAYGMIIAVVFQALLFSYQSHQLRYHRQRRIIKALPPLQTMERLMFEFLVVGVILLSLSLMTGFLFLDNMFAQRLVHKTVLSILAWCIFSTLLIGRWRWGWRGQLATRWIVTGFMLLVLAYFGWRLALEILAG